MLLTNNVVIDEPAERGMTETEDTVVLTISAGSGVVYVYNCTPVDLTEIKVNGVALTALPSGSNPGQSPQFVAVNRYGSPPVFSPSTSFELTFVDGTTYTQTIRVTLPSPASLSLWCFYTGLVLTDPYGTIRQISWGI
jgi:hypothetical protein